MTFTDADRKTINELLATRTGALVTVSAEMMEALLARLGAAEDLILNHNVTPIGYDDRYEAWQKSKG